MIRVPVHLCAKALTVVSAFIIACQYATAAEYRLGPQDRVEIKVYDLRPRSGETHKWDAFDGEFIVDAAGLLSIPLIGQVNAAGKTVKDLSDTISSGVQNKVGLAEMPTAAVQITKYRPFFILGSVEKPGEYDYRPGLTALQALSIAGGIYRASGPTRISIEREKLVQDGELVRLSAELNLLRAQESRLLVESSGDKIVDPLKSPTASAISGKDSEVLSIESNILETRRAALKSKIKALEDTRISLARELDTLEKKEASIEKQIELSQKDLSQVRDLVAKGLSISTRQLAAEQNITSYENIKLDTQLAKLRAQQDLGRVSKDLVETKSKYNEDALVELSKVRQKIAENISRAETARRLIANSDDSFQFSGVLENNFRFFSSNQAASIARREILGDALLGPGDVLEVISRLPNSPSEAQRERTNLDANIKK